MKTLIKPPKLNPGDKIATVSLSWGGAGDPDMRWRYEYGVSHLKNDFGLDVVAMPHSLKGTDFIYNHPQARAEDLLSAFTDPSIKGIISNIGGDDSIRMLPYIDFKIIRKNPKVFMGFSDTTAVHLMCRHAGLSTFYGTSVLCEFSENVVIQPYTKDMIQRTLFSAEPVGTIEPPSVFTCNYPDWGDENATKADVRVFTPHEGFNLLQGRGKVRGRLVGGCLEVLEMCKGTEIFPTSDEWDGAIMFIEIGDEHTTPDFVKYWLRNYGMTGILQKVNGIIFGKPLGNKDFKAYKTLLPHVVGGEFGLPELPILYNLPFGHTSPTCILPHGAVAEIDCDNVSFSILESGVV